MGCACSRDNAEVEDKLIDAEKLLPYKNHDSKFVSVIHSKYSKDKTRLSSEDWLKVTKQLFGHCENTFTEFYDKFKDSDGTYSLPGLSILAIILSKGTSHDKTKFIFEIFDVDEMEVISKDTLREIITIMLELAIDRVPLLSASYYPGSQLFDYVQTLQKNKSICITAIINEFHLDRESQIPFTLFQSILSSEENIELLTLTGLRKRTTQAFGRTSI